VSNFKRRFYLKIERIYLSFYYRLLALCKFSFISFSTKIYCQKGSNFKIGKNVRIRGGGIITIAPGSTLILDDFCWVGPGCIIYCKDYISIGKKARIAHYTSIIDHDYAFNTQVDFDTYITGKIIIGSLVWIGNSSIILKNTIINDNSIIGANSLLKSKTIPHNHIFYDKRESVLKQIYGK